MLVDVSFHDKGISHVGNPGATSGWGGRLSAHQNEFPGLEQCPRECSPDHFLRDHIFQNPQYTAYRVYWYPRLEHPIECTNHLAPLPVEFRASPQGMDEVPVVLPTTTAQRVRQSAHLM